MGKYIARRLVQMIPVFFGATAILFALVYLIPGDPIRAQFGDRRPPEAVLEQARERFGLNDPLPVQYANYIGDLFQGDLGTDFNGRPVVDILKQRYPVTLRLAITAFVIELVLGLAAGVLAGIRRRSFLDSLVLVSTTAVVSIPVFVLGFVSQIVLGLELGWLPVSFDPGDGWVAYVLPGFVLGSLSLAYIARLTRTSLVENLRADYVRTATAKGLGRGRVVGRHTLRNSLIPVLTFLGVDLGNLMGGAIVTEGIFNIPGVGGATFDAINGQEPALVIGIVTVLVIIFIVSTLVVDILYAVLDPRIRYS